MVLKWKSAFRNVIIFCRQNCSMRVFMILTSAMHVNMTKQSLALLCLVSSEKKNNTLLFFGVLNVQLFSSDINHLSSQICGLNRIYTHPSRTPLTLLLHYLPFVSCITMELYSRNVTSRFVGWLDCSKRAWFNFCSAKKVKK